MTFIPPTPQRGTRVGGESGWGKTARGARICKTVHRLGVVPQCARTDGGAFGACLIANNMSLEQQKDVPRTRSHAPIDAQCWLLEGKGSKIPHNEADSCQMLMNADTLR